MGDYCSEKCQRNDWKTHKAICNNCSICYEVIESKDRALTPCAPIKHAYHVNCINNWLKENDTCPVCRTSCLKMEGSKVKTISYKDKRIKITNDVLLIVLDDKMATNGVVAEVGEKVMKYARCVVENNGILSW